MAEPETQELIARTTLTSQFLVAGLVIGPIIFAGIVIVAFPEGIKRPGLPQGQNQPPIFTYAALALGAVALVASLAVPKAVAAAERRRIAKETWAPPLETDAKSRRVPSAAQADAAKLIAVYLTQLIIGAALNEGAAFFALIAYMIEHNPIALATAGALILALVARIPTATRTEQWIDAQLQKIVQEREFRAMTDAE